MPAIVDTLARALAASFPGRVIRRYASANGPTWATVVAWNALFAFFPIVLVAVTILGVLLHDPAMASSLEGRAAAAVGGSLDDQRAILAALEGFRTRTGLLALVGFAGLLWSGSALMGALDRAVNSLYPCPPRSFLRQKLMSVGLILTFAGLTIPLVLSSSLLALLQDIPGLPGLLTATPAALLLQTSLGVLDGVLLFGAIYRVVPNRRQRLRQVLPGAVASGAMLEALTLLFPLYLSLSHGFATYGRTFALFFVLLTYFFCLGQIVMIGATVNAELDHRPDACGSPRPQSGGQVGEGQPF